MHAKKHRLLRFWSMLAVALSLIFGAFPSPASAAPVTHWVAPSGTAGAGTSCADPGFIGFTGLRDAVAAAVDSDTVKVCPGTYSFTESITVTQKSITITGSGTASQSILDGGNATRLFSIVSKKSVTISNLTLQNANAVNRNGGAIYFDVTESAYFDANTHHVVTGNNFYKNHAGETYGGAISVHGYAVSGAGYNFGTASLIEITDNYFAENSAAHDGGAIGGGAFGASTATTGVVIRNNRFAYNRANGRSGGAIAVSHASYTLIGNAIFSSQAGWIGKSLFGEMKSSGNTVINSGAFTSDVPDCSIPTSSRVLTLDGTLDSVAEQDWANNAYCGIFPVDSRTAVMPVFVETTTTAALARVGTFRPQSPATSSTSGIEGGIRLNLNTARSNGGDTLTTYEYSFDKTSFTSFGAGSGTLTTLDITGLTNETSYTVYLRANNSNGASLLSSAITVTAGLPPTAPSAPAMGTASQTSGSTARITFTPPTSNGRSPITGYYLYSNEQGYTWHPYSGQTAITATALNIGTTYTFYVIAVNAVGWSNWSNASNSLTIETPTVTPVNPGPPNLIKFTSVPKLEITGNTATCSSGVAEFWRASITREDAKLDRVLYTLIADGKEVSTLASSVTDPHAKPSSTSPGKATLLSASWTLSAADLKYPMACEEVAFQENASGSTRSVTHENPATLAARAAAAETTKRSEAAAAVALVELNRVLQDFLSTPLSATATSARPSITCRKPGSTKRIRVQGTRCPAGYSR